MDKKAHKGKPARGKRRNATKYIDPQTKRVVWLTAGQVTRYTGLGANAHLPRDMQRLRKALRATSGQR